MYKVGQRVITSAGVGDVLETSLNRYLVYIDFPYENLKPYTVWMDDNDIRKTLDDIRVRFFDEDTTHTQRAYKEKQKKLKTVYRHGRHINVWR